MKGSIIILCLFTLIVVGCNNNEFEKGEGSLLYKFHEDESGDPIKVGDFLGLSYSEKTEEGKVLYNTNDYDSRLQLRFRESSAFKGDFFTGLGLMSQGDSATFKINIDSIIRTLDTHGPTTKGKYLIYTVKIKKVIPRGNHLNDDHFNTAIEQYKQQEIELAQREEASKISRFISDKKNKLLETSSGLKYIITKRDSGPTAKPGDSVKVYYASRYLSGKLFETNSEVVAKKEGIYNALRIYQTAGIEVGHQKANYGFYESLSLFSKGTKATLILQSKLAYGANRYKGLLPYTPILTDIEIVDIKYEYCIASRY